MTKEKLMQIKPLQAEIRLLEIQRDKMQDYYDDDITDKIENLKKQRYSLIGWIDGIEDSLLRQIFRYRYVSGMTWQRVAFKVGEYDESYVRRKAEMYLKKSRIEDNKNA